MPAETKLLDLHLQLMGRKNSMQQAAQLILLFPQLLQQVNFTFIPLSEMQQGYFLSNQKHWGKLSSYVEILQAVTVMQR